MSQQSIHSVNYNSIYENLKKAILSSYKKTKLYTRYALGTEEDGDIIEHNSMMYDIIKNANCHTIDLVNALQQPNFIKTKYGIKDGNIVIVDDSDKLYKIWLSKGNIGTIGDFYESITSNSIDNLTIWEDVEW
jgi:hypothetical protein